MKKNYLNKLVKLFSLTVLLFTQLLSAQSDFYECIPGDGGTSGNARAPHGRFRYQRAVILIKPTEMTASGLVNGDVINSIAFNYLAAQNATTDGTMSIYLENTADATNNKSATWATAITGMTTVSSGAVTIPNTAGNVFFNFSGGSPFTYTGGGVYVAFDYQNATNALPTTFVSVECNSTGLVAGFKGAQSDAAIPTTLANSNFRPVIFLGKSVACARPVNLTFATPTTTSAVLGFTGSGGTFDLEYGPYGFTQGSGTTVLNVTNPYTLSGLFPNSTYSFYVKKNCSTTVSSAWSVARNFHTVFESTTPTYNSGFEQEDFPFIGWLASPSNTANAWFINFGGTGSVLVQEGQSSAVAISPAAAAANENLFSRGINLQAGSNVTVTYFDRNFVNGSTNTSNYTLTVGSAQDITTQTTVLNTTTALSTTTFTERTASFTPATTGTYYFNFNHNSPANAAGTHALIIDNFTVTEVLSNTQFSENSFSVTPNPAKDFVTISTSLETSLQSVSIIDINGRIVKNVSLNGTEGNVNISDLTSGIYMMKIVSDEGTVTKKIIKE